MNKNSLIMNSKRINDCAHRISYQIVESSMNKKEIVLIGIKNNGFIFAKKIHEFLKKITDQKRLAKIEDAKSTATFNHKFKIINENAPCFTLTTLFVYPSLGPFVLHRNQS